VHLDLDVDLHAWPIPRQIQVVINCAAMARLEICKRDPVGSRRVNVDSVIALAEKCRQAGVFFIHLSTDKVFSGQSPSMPPDAPLAPVTEYGKQKADADRYLVGLLTERIQLAIVRLTKVLTPGAALFQDWRDALLRGEVIHPFIDMTLAPVPLPQVVTTVMAIARSRQSGIFQLSGDLDVTYAQVAERLADQLGVSRDLVQPVNAGQSGLFDEMIPPYTSLDCTTTRDSLQLELPSTWDAVEWAFQNAGIRKRTMTDDKHTSPDYTSLVSYYQEHLFNPVLIPVETRQQWALHFAKRVNLYQRHLSIPLSLLRDRSVIEFGCNSGENALVLAALGAQLTLVEPNEQVWPRLKSLFQQFQLEHQINELNTQTIDDFTTSNKYDLVIAEGFLYTLPNRDKLLKKLARLLTPGGLVVISFNDRFGCLLEVTKQAVLWRLCQLADVEDVQSKESLEFARHLYQDAFAELSSSRTFEMWWKDTLVNPFVTSRLLWSYPELFSLIEEAGCEFYSCSPRWVSYDHFQWYKRVSSPAEHRDALLENWRRALPYFLTGLPLSSPVESEAAPDEVINTIAEWIDRISAFTREQNPKESIELLPTIAYPDGLDQYLRGSHNKDLKRFSQELKRLYDVLCEDDQKRLIDTYSSLSLSHLWGSAYHYLCIIGSKSVT
jgi:dTDP-4-dehydrorhamnose reductase/predicted O-methyltransferase YrrM